MSVNEKRVPGLVRSLAVSGVTVALVLGSSVAAPAATALPPLPVVCESVSGSSVTMPDPENPGVVEYRGEGQITCVDLLDGLVVLGQSTYDGRFGGSDPYYHAKVVWDDGTFTEGRFTTFEDTVVAGQRVVLISGTNDAASTRYGGWDVAVTGASAGLGGENRAPVTVVTYTP